MITDLERLTELVSLEKIQAQGFDAPMPVSVSILPKVDHSGDEALEVVYVFPDDTPEEAFAKGRVSDLISWVQDRLSEATDYVLFPYTTIYLESENPLCHA